MSYFFKPAVIASALFFGALTIGAQTYRDDSYYRRDNPSAFGLLLCDRVQADLSRASYDSYGGRRRIERAHKEVSDFERRLSRGDFDKHELDEAIESVKHVVDSNSISGQARSILLEDLDRLRDFRASNGRFHGPEGYRDGRY